MTKYITFILKNLGLAVVLIGLLCAQPALASSKAAAKPDTKSDDPNKPQYVKISPLILPLIGDNGVEQIISLVIALEVEDKAAADKVIEVSPRLADAYLADLYGSVDRRENMHNGLLDVSHIKERLTKVSIKVLGEGKIKAVLVQAVSQHPA